MHNMSQIHPAKNLLILSQHDEISMVGTISKIWDHGLGEDDSIWRLAAHWTWWTMPVLQVRIKEAAATQYRMTARLEWHHWRPFPACQAAAPEPCWSKQKGEFSILSVWTITCHSYTLHAYFIIILNFHWVMEMEINAPNTFFSLFFCFLDKISFP